MHRYFFSLKIAGLVVLAGILVGSIDMWLNGYAVVADPDGQVARAVLREAGADRPMREIGSGFWAARPRSDGAIVVMCRDGRELPGGYVTRGERTRFTVERGACGRGVVAV